MSINEYVFLYTRDLKRLKNEILAYPTEESLWVKIPGTINSGGVICQHLIGNLRTYIGLPIGNFHYVRDREAEFSARLFSKETLLQQVDLLLEIIPDSIGRLSDNDLSGEYPHEILTVNPVQSYSLVLSHLVMHLSWHTGQINYHRRIVEAALS